MEKLAAFLLSPWAVEPTGHQLLSALQTQIQEAGDEYVFPLDIKAKDLWCRAHVDPFRLFPVSFFTTLWLKCVCMWVCGEEFAFADLVWLRNKQGVRGDKWMCSTWVWRSHQPGFLLWKHTFLDARKSPFPQEECFHLFIGCLEG